MFSKSFTIPSGAPASVSIIDTTGRVAGCGIDSLLQPPMNGFSTLPTFPSLAFLIESQDGRNVLFDLGIPQDWRELPPIVSDELKSSGWVITVPQTTAEILEENKVAADSIESVVWRFVTRKWRRRCCFFLFFFLFLFSVLEADKIAIGIGITSGTYINSQIPLSWLSDRASRTPFYLDTRPIQMLLIQNPISS